MVDVTALCDRIDAKIREEGCESNPFFALIQARPLSAAELKLFADQFYLVMRSFPRSIAGLAARVDVDEVCAELAKTVVVELGEGQPGRAHSHLFEKALGPMGIRVRDDRAAYHTPETVALIEGVRRLYLEGPVLAALGGNYTIERSGLPMLKALYEGFRLLPGSTVQSLEFFYLHLAIEGDHIRGMASSIQCALEADGDAGQIEEGAARVARLLGDFWRGIHRRIEAGEPSAVTAADRA